MWNPCICQGLSIRMFTCPTKLILADMRNTKQCIPAIFLSRLVWNVPRRQTGHDLSAHNTHKQTNKTPTHTHPHLQSWSVSPISDLLRKTSDFPSCESDSRTKIQGLVVTINKRSQSCVKAGPVCVCVCVFKIDPHLWRPFQHSHQFSGGKASYQLTAFIFCGGNCFCQWNTHRGW